MCSKNPLSLKFHLIKTRPKRKAQQKRVNLLVARSNEIHLRVSLSFWLIAAHVVELKRPFDEAAAAKAMVRSSIRSPMVLAGI
jgi:hypothetical protein